MPPPPGPEGQGGQGVEGRRPHLRPDLLPYIPYHHCDVTVYCATHHYQARVPQNQLIECAMGRFTANILTVN